MTRSAAASPGARVEIIAVGSELLLGQVSDTNTAWLCRQLREMGAVVGRATVVPDEPAAIEKEIERAREDTPRLLLTSGGLGPTDDDRTLRAFARALSAPLEENATALEMVRRWYALRHAAGDVDSPTLTSERRKMAQLPRGSEPLDNPVGAAPGVWLESEGVAYAALPGVPSEMRAIFAGSLQPHLARSIGLGAYRELELYASSGDESELAPLLEEVAARHPGVYLKSRAKGFGPGRRFPITLSAAGRDPARVERTLADAEADLRGVFAAARIGLTLTK